MDELSEAVKKAVVARFREELEDAFCEAEKLVDACQNSCIWQTCVEINGAIDIHWSRLVGSVFLRAFE